MFVGYVRRFRTTPCETQQPDEVFDLLPTAESTFQTFQTVIHQRRHRFRRQAFKGPFQHKLVQRHVRQHLRHPFREVYLAISTECQAQLQVQVQTILLLGRILRVHLPHRPGLLQQLLRLRMMVMYARALCHGNSYAIVTDGRMLMKICALQNDVFGTSQFGNDSWAYH